MSIFKFDPSTNIIHISTFETCLETSRSRKEIIKLYPKRSDGAYYLDKFINHLKEEVGIGIKEYCKKHFNFEWPICSVKNKDLGFNISGKGIEISRYSPGSVNKNNCEAFRLGCEKLSKERMGEGNPMYGKATWNKGLSLEDPRIEKMAQARRGKEASADHKEKLKKHYHKHWPKNGKYPNSGSKYSEETKNKMSLESARRWAAGCFNKVTSIHIKVRDFLKTLNLKEEWVEEFQVKYFSFDFAFPSVKVGIEAQGTFFHIDPRVYPDGPICAIQRRNFGRDEAKRKVCSGQEGWEIIEVWEKEINNGEFEEFLLCRLRELNLLEE